MLARMNAPSGSATHRCQIRPAQHCDLPELVALESAVFETDRLSRDRFLHWLRAPNCTFLVACDTRGCFAGYALVLYRRNSSKARLYSIAVMPACRGQGIARQLLSACEQTARQRHCSGMTLEVRPDNRAALQVYDQSGYRHTRHLRHFYEDGTDAIRLEKTLP